MSKINSDKLLITSDFYSVQGEGISTGIPSYFIRLGICNLSCGMSQKWFNSFVKENKDLNEDEKIPDGSLFKGDLHEQGLATWTCDSTSQWAIRGEEKEFQYIIDRWKEQGLYNDILNQNIRIIWTGGEPTIKGHQESIQNFSKYLEKLEPEKYNNVFYELETNGTNYMTQDFISLINQINCSPKLSNSGMDKKRRIIPYVINQIMDHTNYQFKFVISNEEDVKEIFKDFIEPFNIPLSNIVCMPGMDSQEEFHERTQFVLEMAKKYKFRGLTRLHISAWDKTLNV